MPIKIDFLANVRNFLRGTDDADAALDDVADSLDDMADAAKKGGRDAERAVEKLEDGFRDAARRAKDLGEAGKDAGRDVKRGMDDAAGDGFGKLGEAASEVTQEVGQNLGEAVSSVRGNLADLGQVGQDTLGGLAATLAGTGPAGIAGAAALAAGAVGLGLVTAELEKQQAHTAQLKQYFSEAWKAAVQGGRDYIDQATVIGEMQDIMFNPDRAEEYKKIQADANKLGLDRNTLLRAAAGDQTAYNVVMGRSSDLYTDQEKALQKVIDRGAERQDSERIGILNEMDDLDKLNGRWQEYGDINSDNKQKARDAAQATSDYLLDAVSKASSATRAVDDFGNMLITLPDGQEVVIEAKTGQATSDVSKFKTDTDGVIDSVNGREVVLKTRTEVDRSQYDAFVRELHNSTIKIKGRIVTTPGWDQ